MCSLLVAYYFIRSTKKGDMIIMRLTITRSHVDNQEAKICLKFLSLQGTNSIHILITYPSPNLHKNPMILKKTKTL